MAWRSISAPWRDFLFPDALTEAFCASFTLMAESARRPRPKGKGFTAVAPRVWISDGILFDVRISVFTVMRVREWWNGVQWKKRGEAPGKGRMNFKTKRIPGCVKPIA